MKAEIFMVVAMTAVFAVLGADPTVPADALADALKRRLANGGGLRLHALVTGADGEGVALVGEDPRTAAAVRSGSVLRASADGMGVDVVIRKVGAEGVELETAKGSAPLVLPGSYLPLPPPENPPREFLRYLECDKVPLGRLMRLVADRSGVNISPSAATADKPISIFLRNVTAEAAVEEICRSASLWFRRDPGMGIVRVTTMEEYAENLETFREETTAAFTLLYPNVLEVAAAIYGLYPERTLLSLGEQELQEDDEYDLARRFRSFRVLEENGNAQFMEMQAPRASASSGRSGASNFSFSRGNALSRLAQWEMLSDRRRRRWKGTAGTLPADMAKFIDGESRAGGTNSFEGARSQFVGGAANIFVSMSRKNNMLMVRTSDVKVMDEIRTLVKRLDVPTPMVLLEVKVLELDVTDGFDALFEYSFNRAAGDLGTKVRENGDNIFAEIAQTGVRDSFTPTFAFKTLSSDLVTKIRLLQQDGKVKTLATPTLLTANNEVSRIFNGKEYPLVSGWTAGATDTTQGIVTRTEPTVEIERKDVGTMLLITPNINSDRTVTLRILQENSSVSPDKVSIPVTGGTGESKDIEYVVSRSLTGTFVAKDGMSIMAGGLIDETESEKYYRTPVLGSIPLLGWLFRGTEKMKRRTEMIVLMRPHVIMTPFEGGKASEELLKALSAHPVRDGRDSLMIHRDAATGALKEEHTSVDDVENIVK